MGATAKIVNLMSDGKRHSNVELCQISGWRFGGRLFDLRKMGFTFEKEGDARKSEDSKEYWKLISSPTYEIVGGKIMTLNGKIKRMVKRTEREKPKTFLQKILGLFE